MSPTKRLDEARRAFALRDERMAAAAHAPARGAQAAEEHGGAGRQNLGQMVYGGLDGIITTLAVVSGVAGVEQGAAKVLVTRLNPWRGGLAAGMAYIVGAVLKGFGT